MAVWCATQLQADSADLAAYLFDPPRPLHPADLGGPVDEIAYRRLWGRWTGREAEFYAQCAALIHPLDWPAVVELCGPPVRVLASHVAAAYAQLLSQAVPTRLRAGRLEMIGGGPGVYHVTSYSPNDPLLSLTWTVLDDATDGYSSRSASTGATLDARSAGSNDAASTVARDVAAAISSVRESLGAMP